MTLLTVGEFREHQATALGDDPLQRLLDAAEALILRVAGPLGSTTEYFDAWAGLTRDVGSRYLVLKHRLASITSITEWYGTGSDAVLDATDYRVGADLLSIERLVTGVYPAVGWQGPIAVVYQTADDTALREIVQLSLVKGYLADHPGAVSETIGDWSETFANAAEWMARQDSVLGQLVNADVGFV